MLSTYAYATQFLTERDLHYPAIIGNFLYAVAVVSPGLYIALFAFTSLIGILGPVLKSSTAQHVLIAGVSAILGALATKMAVHLERALGRKEKKAATEQLEREEMQFLQRAEILLDAGYYDLAVVEAWKAVEVAARRTLLDRDIPSSPRPVLYREIEKHQLLPNDLLVALRQIREARNNAAHARGPISKDKAQTVLASTTRILAALTSTDKDLEDA
jgi:HEPN domain-containing protein